MTRAEEKKLLDDIFLQPWFLPLPAAIAIRKLLPKLQHHKMRFYFDDYGCIICRKKTVRYGHNGMCVSCGESIKLKIMFAVKRRWTVQKPTNLPTTFKRIGDAQKMLEDLLGHARSSK